MYTDHHLHTKYSPDSRAELADYCKRALETGLRGFVVTDHVDMPPWDSWQGKPFDCRRDESYAEVQNARELYPALYIGFGMELGNELYDAPRAARYLADSRLDFVIGSMHTLSDGVDFYVRKYDSAADCEYRLAEYVRQLVPYCETADLDVLGHLTYPIRYMPFRPDFTKERDGVAAAFEALIRRGKGIELNVSGLRGSFGETSPPAYYLRLFKDLGGEIVTLGSDAHDSPDIGARFDEGAELLRACGFEHTAVYSGRTAEMVRL